MLEVESQYKRWFCQFGQISETLAISDLRCRVLGTTLQRMIFWELVRVFLLALCGLTGLFLMGGVVQEASQRGLTPSQIFYVVPLLIPNTLPYTVPATILFACCIVYGRMAHDSEITALRAAGVHLGRLLAPAIVLASLVTIGLMLLQSDLIPRTRQLLADRVMTDADELVCSMLRRNGHLKLPEYSVFVREVRGKQFVDAIVKKRTKDGYSVVAHAKEASLVLTDLLHDRIEIFMPHCSIIGADAEGNGTVRSQTFPVSFPSGALKDTAVRPMNMTGEQIAAAWDEIAADRARRQEQQVRIEEQLKHDEPARDHLAVLQRDNEFHIKDSYRIELALRAESQLRLALALGGLCFVLVAVPVGIRFHRADYLSTFVSCFLPVVMIYYPLLLAGTNLAREGRLTASISVWIADIATGVAGTYMLRRLFRQ
jgi:lipopolysaccharide export system permease protein